MLTLLLACTSPVGDSSEPLVDSSPEVEDSPVDSEHVGSCGELEEPAAELTLPAVELSSDVTWTLDFDETAEAAGLFDCSYRRTYEGLERLDRGYLCPDCDHFTGGTATMQEGLDCFEQISSAGAERPEWWGWNDEAIFRTSGSNYRLGQVTDVEVVWEGQSASFTWGSVSELSDGGLMDLAAVGTMSYRESETLLPDPWAPRQTPYVGGWPQDDPGDLELDYDLEIGSTFPNVRLLDQCQDTVDLWDFHGRWLVIDSSQPNCGPCQAMAADFGALQEELAAEGIDAQMVTYMGVSLSDPLQPADPETIDLWIETYGSHGPVFQDEGFAYAVFNDDLQEISGDDSFGWPAWVLVGPDMKVVDGFIGYGGFDDVAATIRAAEGG
ncbi:MAG: redoxin domain-containing protein [Proteobacteria bacterium]|nr:redoxin domain-containing protein [Pseudomonadota bacterium]